jgi:bleomycin hydrolase
MKAFYNHILLSVLLLSFGVGIQAQDDVKKEEGYQINPVYTTDYTEVKSQGMSGTCWSFCTTSFLESEMIRLGKDPVDLSEMWIVRQIYLDKFQNYIRRDGHANFSQGGLSHDLMNAYSVAGIVPEQVFDGKREGMKIHRHGELEAVLKGMADGVLKKADGELSEVWLNACEEVLDVYLGDAPEQFEYNGKDYTSLSFADEVVGIDPADYVELTSFSHHPFYTTFVLEIPDNYSNGSYYNIPIDELMEVMGNALKEGYSIAWDGDVSEKGFSARYGLAIVPETPWNAIPKSERDIYFKTPHPEKEITQENRQSEFNDAKTTDDHLMHITGLATDQNGVKYYLTKNSWGMIGPMNGLMYMSDAYVKLKTVAIMIHKDAIPKHIRKKLGL